MYRTSTSHELPNSKELFQRGRYRAILRRGLISRTLTYCPPQKHDMMLMLVSPARRVCGPGMDRDGAVRMRSGCGGLFGENL